MTARATSKQAKKPAGKPAADRATEKAAEPAANRSDEPPDMAELAGRYLDLWQEEVAAIAADPGASDALGRWFGSVGRQMADPAAWQAAFGAMTAAFSGPLGGAKQDDDGSTDATSGAAPAGAASVGGASDVARLAKRVAALERQMDELAGARAADQKRGGVARAGRGSRGSAR